MDEKNLVVIHKFFCKICVMKKTISLKLNAKILKNKFFAKILEQFILFHVKFLSIMLLAFI